MSVKDDGAVSGRILGLDYGSKTVGVAVSDSLGITAQPVETIWRGRESKLRQTLSRIEELKAEYGAELVVLGFPLNMNDTLGERADKTLEFKEMLEKRLGLPVVLQDERLTTYEAEQAMLECGIKDRRERKKKLDSLSAVLILQSFLDKVNEDG